ncbi:MAG: OmpA family protein [Saprospiraceae bacterium]
MMFSRLFFIYLVTLLFSCSFSQKIKTGEMAYERRQYATAIGLLEPEYNESRSEAAKGRKAWLLANCYNRLLEYQESKSWYEKAVAANYGVEALAGYAKTAKILEEYELAIAIYQKLGEVSGRKQETDREILLCRQAMDYKSRKPEYQVERIFENSTVSDYSPVLYDEQYLVFTSERKDATGKNVYLWSGEKYSDIFIMAKSGSEVRRFDAAINSDHNDGTPWFSKDLNTMYFTRCYNEGSGDDYCKLLISNRINGVWDDANILPFVTDKVNYGQPTLIENDSVLVFTADIAEPGGPTDLYYVELYEDGSWGVPEKLPASINSQGNEKFPTGDGDTLYFSSDYLPGLGGYDIFKTYLREDGAWTIPINMGYPINSGGDDFSFTVDYKAKPRPRIIQQGYLTSSRSGSGKDDIFRFAKLMPEPPKEPVIIAIDSKKDLFITVRTFTPVYEIEDDPNSKMTGRLALGETLIKWNEEATNEKIAEDYTDKNGFYFKEAPSGTSIKVIAAKLGFLNASKIIDTRNVVYNSGEKSKTINVDLILDRIYPDKEINLKNIYYEFDKWDIVAEAKPTLNELIKLLNDNPQVNIQLSSHTDCRGELDYNQELSQKRAQSAVDYLILGGIAKSRLIARGYGESQLVDQCPCESCTEDQHQSNRRTTFKIIKR